MILWTDTTHPVKQDFLTAENDAFLCVLCEE